MAIVKILDTPLPATVGLGSTQYAMVIPASAFASVPFTIGAWRLLFSGGPAGISHVWSGAKGAGDVDFDGSQQQVKFSGVDGAVIPQSGDLASDVIAGPFDTSADFLVTLDGIPSQGGTYNRADGLPNGFRYFYKAGNAGVGNGNTTRTNFEASASGLHAFVSGIEVAESAADFDAVVVPPPEPTPPPDDNVPQNHSADAEQTVSDGRVFTASGTVAGIAGEMTLFAIFNPAGSDIRVVVDQVLITTDADTELSTRSIVSMDGVIMPTHCNHLFATPGSPSKAKLRTATQSPPFDGNTALHGNRKVIGGQERALNKSPVGYPLVELLPGDIGFCVALHEVGVGATIEVCWKEHH